jgi:hypothetical protein
MAALSLLLVSGWALLTASCGGSSEENMAKEVAASKATWLLTVNVDGAEVKLPLGVMNVLLFKNEEDAKQIPSTFEIVGGGVHLLGEIPAESDVGYGEKWENLVGKTLTVKPSGEFHREPVESTLTLPGKAAMKVLSGSLAPGSVKGKWSGSNGDKTISGRITLLLQDGRTVEGTFAVHGVTWG